MENKKLNLRKATITGLALGILGAGILTSGISAKLALDRYNFGKWAQDMETHRSLSLSVEESQINGGYVYIVSNRKTNRTNTLYTDSLATCCGLVIDDEKGGEHYLAHFTSMQDKKDIIDSITNNFSKLEGLEFTVVLGIFPDSSAARQVYAALKELGVDKKLKRVRSERILIKEGKRYYPSMNI